jgi:hypothetical protein
MSDHGELIDPTEAFEEGEKERLEKLREQAIHVAKLPLIGGPRHGGEYRMPMELLQNGRPFSFPVLGQNPEVEAAPRVYGEYMLDRGMMVLRYESRR